MAAEAHPSLQVLPQISDAGQRRHLTEAIDMNGCICDDDCLSEPR